LSWPLLKTPIPENSAKKPVDLGITILHTPGHTPDELAWYDHDEMFLYVGDSFYERGGEGMDIIFPAEGNLVEWWFSMMKLKEFVRRHVVACTAWRGSGGRDEDYCRRGL
jgi:glyoxylase-like metal-dependent hydrolase (beta-lactamase superfamily II)